MRQDRCACTVVSLFSHYPYCSRMHQLTMRLPVLGAAVNPEALTQAHAMRSRRVTIPSAPMEGTAPTVRCDDRPNPNGAKLNTAGTTPRTLERSRAEGFPWSCPQPPHCKSLRFRGFRLTRSW